MWPEEVPLPATPASVATDSTHGCVVLVDGRVLCWGENRWGERGVGVRWEHNRQPERVPLPEPADEVVIGRDRTCARLRSGRAMCWGEWADQEVQVPTLVTSGGEPIEDVVRIVAGAAVDRWGALLAWDALDAAELVLESGIVDVAMTDHQAYALDRDGRVHVVTWRPFTMTPVPDFPRARWIHCDEQTCGALTEDPNDPSATAITRLRTGPSRLVGDEPSSFTIEENGGCFHDAAGVHCWGEATAGLPGALTTDDLVTWP